MMKCCAQIPKSNETASEMKLRVRNQQLHQWHHDFWLHHNTAFEQVGSMGAILLLMMMMMMMTKVQVRYNLSIAIKLSPYIISTASHTC